jgi:hypothetical protein
MTVPIVLQAIQIARQTFGTSESGITWSSDQITYPSNLVGQVLPDDANDRSQTVAWIHKTGGLDGLLADDSIYFTVHGNFRPYSQVILDDPASVVTPVLANVYVSYYSALGQKATETQLEIHFTALDTAFNSAEDPRVRFICEGHYDPAGPGDVRFAVVVEIDTQANVTLIENRSGPDTIVTDDSPNGFDLTLPDN